MQMMSAALAYAARGWPIVLLYGVSEGTCKCPKQLSCDTNMIGKHPIVGCGKDDATTSVEQIVEWFGKWSSVKPNIGIVTGNKSGIVVLDVDPRNGGEESLKQMTARYGELPVTLKVRTGSGGTHYYFRHPGEGRVVRTTASFLGRGLDTKADNKTGGTGGYVVAPPSMHRNGSAYEWYDESLTVPVSDMPSWLLELLSPGPSKAASDGSVSQSPEESGGDIIEGQRHNYLIRKAGKLRHDNWDNEAILAALLMENQRKCKPPVEEEEVRKIASAVVGYDSPLFRFDDVGNGKRLAHTYSHQLKHCWAKNAWYIWEGKRWQRDETGQINHFAKNVVEIMHDEASKKGDSNFAKLMKSHAHMSGRVERIRAMIDTARSEKALNVRFTELDADPLLLNVLNGTLELANEGRLRKHEPKDLLTKLALVAYKPEARSLLWEGFLKDTTNGDEEFIDFLQRTAGYALSGLTREEYIFFVYGPGGTGKSTYFEAIKSILGDDYCKTASFATFLKAGHVAPNAPRSDIARLPGARLVTAIEAAEGKQFAADVLKAATGGDKLVTRDLYQSEFEFIPQYKLWLASNSKPRVREDDSGMWRRLLLLPFYHVVENPDKTLKEKFRFEPEQQEAILAWCVRGFIRWQQDGLRMPAVVQRETGIYKAEMDPISVWLEDCTQKMENTETGYCQFKTLWASYDAWVKQQPGSVKDTRIETAKGFGMALQKHGFVPGLKSIGGKPARVYEGIQLLF